MKSIQILFYTIALVGLLSCNKDELVIQQGECMPFSISDTYEYPIIPGTDEWADLKSLTEKVQACQIPSSKLKSISTEGLLETLLTYPLILDYGAFNMQQDGFERIKSENNGFSELYGRTDFINVITDRFKLMSLNCDKNYYPPFIGGLETPIQISFQTIELFILQDELLNEINSNQRIQLLETVLEKLQAKEDYGISQNENLVLYAILGKIMIKENYSPFVDINDKNEIVAGLARIPIGFDSELLDLIEDNAKELKASR